MPLSDDLARAALAAAPDATFVIDRSGRIRFASNRVTAVYGYTPAELIGQSVDIITPDRLKEMFTRYRARFLAAPAPILIGVEHALYGVTKDGREIPVELGLSAMTLGDEALIVCAIRDISPRMSPEEAFPRTMRRMEERLASAYAHFRLFVEHSLGAAVMMDRDLRYIVASRRWREDYKFIDCDIVGLHHYDVFPDLPERWKQAHQRCLAGEPSSADEDSYLRADGQVEWLRWELQPWRAEDGQIGGVILFSEIITQSKLAEQALRASQADLERRVAERTQALEEAKNEAVRANALKSRFVAAASHDLRQPLQAAGAYLSALARRLDQPQQQEICDKMRQALDATAEILQALLDLSKFESGAIRPQLQVFQVRKVVESVVGQSSVYAEEKGLRIVLGDITCTVYSDPGLLRRVLDNIVSNAIRYTEAGEITISCEHGADVVRIRVADTGVGIPPQSLESIFEEYVQLDNPARQRGHGFGLGLAIAKNIATLLGGRIEVQSTLGRGSVFCVELPDGRSLAEATDEKTHAAPDEAAGATPPLRVLVIDDDPMVTDAMSLLLQGAGFDVHCARGGEEALAALAAGVKPNVIVSDFRLPHNSGVEVISRARAFLGAPLPAVLMTGDTAMRDGEAGSLCACTVLHKPVDPDMLIALLRRLAA
jgi:PAS domain S-box-containing protein